jgi:hypothetical protein
MLEQHLRQDQRIVRLRELLKAVQMGLRQGPGSYTIATGCASVDESRSRPQLSPTCASRRSRSRWSGHRRNATEVELRFDQLNQVGLVGEAKSERHRER